MDSGQYVDDAGDDMDNTTNDMCDEDWLPGGNGVGLHGRSCLQLRCGVGCQR